MERDVKQLDTYALLHEGDVGVLIRLSLHLDCLFVCLRQRLAFTHTRSSRMRWLNDETEVRF
jgi:hypothetical protein